MTYGLSTHHFDQGLHLSILQKDFKNANKKLFFSKESFEYSLQLG